MNWLTQTTPKSSETKPSELPEWLMLLDRGSYELGEWRFYPQHSDAGKPWVAVVMLYGVGSQIGGGGQVRGSYVVEVAVDDPTRLTRPCVGCGHPVRLVVLRELFWDKLPLCDAHCQSGKTFAERAAAVIKGLEDRACALRSYFGLPPQ